MQMPPLRTPTHTLTHPLCLLCKVPVLVEFQRQARRGACRATQESEAGAGVRRRCSAKAAHPAVLAAPPRLGKGHAHTLSRGSVPLDVDLPCWACCALCAARCVASTGVTLHAV